MHDEERDARTRQADLARIAAENGRLLERLAEGDKRFRLVSRGVLRAQEAERGRISRELHDEVGQSLTALKIELDRLADAAAQRGDPLSQHLLELAVLAERSLHEVRQICHRLRPQMLDDLGLEATLRWFARTFEKRTGIAVELRQEGIAGALDPDIETLVFRVVQEALTNVAKHAGVTTVSVRLTAGVDCVTLSVRDEGAGFDAAQALASSDDDGGFGLRGMRDRVQLFHGRFAVRSKPGAGTLVEVSLPLFRDEGRSRP